MEQVTNHNLIICFNCEGKPGFYYEFEDGTELESPDCPLCGRNHNTMPKYYLEQMPIQMLVQLFQEYAANTPFFPVLDLKFQDFKLPDGIVIQWNKKNLLHA